ncbi:glycosyltransferase family 4 protein [Lutibacter sp.]|uniref:glycosyltransferase family 4 protein n=1 Tax=Lutibacter sp. TaxID=1925666 RepID=UPI00345C370D
MQWADHIHLRCPGNIGLLGCVVQLLFMNKPKTVKYAGNWDPKSAQPRSYRLQKWIVSNTFLTRNCKVLVYGDWPNQSKNIVPFFTASYSEEEIEAVEIRNISQNKDGMLKQVQHDDSGHGAMNRHPEFISGSDGLEHNDEMLKQVQYDENKRHPEFSSGSHGVEYNDEILKQVQPDGMKDEMLKQVQYDEMKDEMLKQVQHDEIKDEMLKQVQHDEIKDEMLKQVQHDGMNDEMLKQVQHGATNRHPEFSSGFPANKLKFIYVGGLVPGKQPLLSVQVVHELKRKGYNVQLDMYGEGIERTKISDYILDNSLEEVVFLHGNAHKEIVKKAYQQAHFLVFISKSEGWPKVVAEAMFWGCVPLSSAVSCVPEMLGNGSRGTLVSTNVAAIVRVVEGYINNEETYKRHAENAMEWSRAFTLERFKEEIGRLL